MKKFITILLILATIGMVIWGVTRPFREDAEWANLLEQTSDKLPIKRKITVLGDDWLGYLVLRSPEFKYRMAQDGYGVNFKVEADFDTRIEALRDGSADFIVLTLDSYLVNGAKHGWPGAVIFVIDESFGGDVIVGHSELENIDGLNNEGIKGAFVADSPSEFLLRAKTTHFQLDNLRPRIDAMQVDSIEDAYKKFARKQADFAVLWEPLASRALKEIPGAKIIIDTKHAQGIIIDLALASRKVLADEPEVVEAFSRAYFATLHDLLNSPTNFQLAAARDTGKSPDEAATMLAGIKFATLEDNREHWLSENGAAPPALAVSSESIEKILNDHAANVSLPNDDPMSVLYRSTVSDLSKNRKDVSRIVDSRPRTSGNYPPLSRARWEELIQKERGTLLDKPITFRPGSTEIPADFEDVLREAVPKMKHYPTYRLVVEAHVAPSNDPEADLALSEERAIAVKRFLMWECGIPEERIHMRGIGGAEPPERRTDESMRAWERRARRARIVLVGD